MISFSVVVPVVFFFQRAKLLQNFKLKNQGEHPVFSEFSVSNPESGKTYKVAIRGDSAGINYCSCPDFSINNSGAWDPCIDLRITTGSWMTMARCWDIKS
jgi:hypothetical protein